MSTMPSGRDNPLAQRPGRRARSREPALADPGRAIHEHIPRLAFTKRIVEGAEQHLELGCAPNERRLERGMAHDRFDCPRP
jgi:hypothetical protein